MNVNKLLIVVFLIVLFISSYAQEYINFNERNGLPSNRIYRITQDTKGFIWIATDRGIARYDGTRFKNFTVRDGLKINANWNLLPTPDGKVWFLAKSAYLGYIENDSVYSFSSHKKDVFFPISAGVIENKISLVQPDKSFLFDKQRKQWLEIQPPETDYLVLSYIEHEKWTFLLKNSDTKSYFLYNNEETQAINLNPKEEAISLLKQITDSLFLFLGREKYFVLNLNTEELHERLYKDEVGIERLESPRINYANNEIQISSKEFVGKLNKDYGLSDVHIINQGNNPQNAFIDKQNTIWVATFSEGVYKSSQAKQKAIYSYLNNKVGRLMNVNGKVVAMISGKGFYQYNTEQMDFMPYVKSKDYLFGMNYIPQEQKEFYLTNKTTIIKSVNGEIEERDVRMPLRSITFLDGYFYGQHFSGLSKFKISDSKINLIKNYQCVGIRSIFNFDKRIIIETSDGIKQLINDTILPLSVGLEEFYSVVKLSDTEILVSALQGGAYVTNLKTVIKLPRTDGLSVGGGYKRQNRLWLATDNGVVEFEEANKTYRFIRRIDRKNGLPTNKINSVMAVDDRLLVATNFGITNLSVDSLEVLDLVNFYIQKAFYSNINLKKESAPYYNSGNIVEFEISTINFSDDIEPIEYAYKLHPIQKKWQRTKSTKLNFNDLSPNKYELIVSCKDLKESIQFRIKPRWYQTKMFIGFIVLSLLGIIIFFSGYMSYLLEKKKNKKIVQLQKMSELQLKALRSQMNPHFIFNSLSAIQYYIDKNDAETSDTYLVKFSRLARNFFELSSKQTISIEKDVDLLSNYLDLERLRFKEKLFYEIYVDPELDTKCEIPCLLLQPVVENAINHGILNKVGSGTVKISFLKKSKNEIEIIISDDGVGIERTLKEEKRITSSSVLQERIQLINEIGRWSIELHQNNLTEEDENKGHLVKFRIKNNT